MTNVNYVITKNGKVVGSKHYKTFPEIKEALNSLGSDFGYKTIYTEFDPEDTPERREKAKKHAEKVQAKLKEKKNKK